MDTPPTAVFGNLLRRARESRGLSQRSLARQAGLDSTYISRLERGIVPPPKVPTVHQLAAGLHLDPGEEIELIHASGRLPDNVAATPRMRNAPTNDAHSRELRAAYFGLVLQWLRALYGDIVIPDQTAHTIHLHFETHSAVLSVVPWQAEVRLLLTIPLSFSMEEDSYLAWHLLRHNAALPLGAFCLDDAGGAAFQDSIPASICSEQDLTAWVEAMLDTADRHARRISVTLDLHREPESGTVWGA